MSCLLAGMVFLLSVTTSGQQITGRFYAIDDSHTGSETAVSDTVRDAGSFQAEKRVALTFDDGPNETFTPKLLDGLKERNVKATFFVLGKQAEQFPQLVKRIVEEGHQVGCHGYEHVNMLSLSMEEACTQMNKTSDLLLEITGQRPLFMRPPYGSCQKKLAERSQMIEVGWGIDTLDWSLRNADQVVAETLRKVEDGSIILMHDEFQESVDAALRLADVLQKEGYQLVTVEDLILD